MEDTADPNDASSSSTARPVPDLQVLPPTPAMTSFPSDIPWRTQSSQGSYRDDVDGYEENEDDDDLVVHPSGTIPAERDPLFNPESYKGRRGSYDPDEAEDEGREMLSEQQILQDQRGVMDGQYHLASSRVAVQFLMRLMRRLRNDRPGCTIRPLVTLDQSPSPHVVTDWRRIGSAKRAAGRYRREDGRHGGADVKSGKKPGQGGQGEQRARFV